MHCYYRDVVYIKRDVANAAAQRGINPLRVLCEVVQDFGWLVGSETLLDTKVFLDNLQYMEILLKHGWLVIKTYRSLDEMLKKPFTFQSFDNITTSGGTVEEVIHQLPEEFRGKISQAAKLIEEYAIPRQIWLDEKKYPLLSDIEQISNPCALWHIMLEARGCTEILCST